MVGSNHEALAPAWKAAQKAYIGPVTFRHPVKHVTTPAVSGKDHNGEPCQGTCKPFQDFWYRKMFVVWIIFPKWKMIQLPLGRCNETKLPAFECPSLGQIECHDKNWNPVPENADLCKVRDMWCVKEGGGGWLVSPPCLYSNDRYGSNGRIDGAIRKLGWDEYLTSCY